MANHYSIPSVFTFEMLPCIKCCVFEMLPENTVYMSLFLCIVIIINFIRQNNVALKSIISYHHPWSVEYWYTCLPVNVENTPVKSTQIRGSSLEKKDKQNQVEINHYELRLRHWLGISSVIYDCMVGINFVSLSVGRLAWGYFWILPDWLTHRKCIWTCVIVEIFFDVWSDWACIYNHWISFCIYVLKFLGS